MLKRILVILVLALTQAGCDYGEDISPFKRERLNDGITKILERQKRELLQIEDIKVGTGSVASWGRRLSADLTVRYADGTLVYQGPIYTYVGFVDITAITNDIRSGPLLTISNEGIQLGLNGMAVGGQRRFTVDRSMVCVRINLDAGPKASCGLADRTEVRKETLLVEATLTESCIPLTFRAFYLNGGYLFHYRAGCRNSDLPQLDPTLPFGTFTKSKKEWADRLIATSPFSYALIRSISPYNSPFVDSTFPANRSSNIVA
ncbi:MAG: hypothetical protein HOP32_07405 [Nitrospira sp.]|nr:hypothetical protein [Nitrospira sp.]